MEWQFTTTASGHVEVTRSSMPIFTRVLNDCIGTLAPRGAPAGLSTYWIEEAMKEFRPQLSSPEGSAMFSGNASYLELIDGLVEARFHYDPPDGDIVERVPLPEVIAILEEWRRVVIALDSDAPKRVPPPRPAIALGPPAESGRDQ
jgi:hypothetical protein